MNRISRLAFSAAALLAPFSASAETTTTTQPVVYGQDDRVDPSEHPDENIRRLAQDSIVAIIPKTVIDASSLSDVGFFSQTLGQAQGLCDGERFTDNPTAGVCSGTLIGPDLVLTAGHCVSNGQASCEQLFAVFNYEWLPATGGLDTITVDDIYACQTVITQALSDSGGVTRDFAIFQLDRPVTGYAPANVVQSRPSLSAGDPFVLIGSPSGIPMKVDDGGTVRDPRASSGDFLTGNPDTFGGNSGSGVFLADSLDLFGVLISGDTDYVTDGGCTRVNVCSSSGCGGENILYATAAIDSFCDVATDEALCGTVAVCGDGFCAFDERESCSEDCTAATCGDNICQGEWESCSSDCIVEAPPEWTCEAAYYGTLDGCDCDCGALDPDCALGQSTLNCSAGETCGDDGTCESSLAGLCDCASTPDQNKSAALALSMIFGLALVASRRKR